MKTWAILFTNNKNEKNRRHDYNLVSFEIIYEEYWKVATYELLPERLINGRTGAILGASIFADVRKAALRKDLLSYTQFPFYETRLL